MKRFPLTAVSSAIMMSFISSNHAMAANTGLTANTNEHLIMSEDVINNANLATAIFANGVDATIDTDGYNIVTTGNSSSGVSAANGGLVNVTGGKINVSGRYSIGVSSAIDGTVIVNDVDVSVTSDNAQGVVANGGAINLNRTSVLTSGNKSYGITSESLPAATSVLNINDSKVSTEGNQSHAVSASTGTVNINNTELTTTGNTSRGVSVAGTASVNLENVIISTAGAGRSDGITVTYGTLTGDAVNIHTQGEESYGVVLGAGGSLSLSNTSVISEQYAAANFTTQTTQQKAVATFENSSLQGFNLAFGASDSASGEINLINSTASSSMGVLGYAGSAGNGTPVGAKLVINASKGSKLSGTTNAINGSSLQLNLTDGSLWEVGGNATLTGLNLVNSTIDIAGNANRLGMGNVVTVNGNYFGDGGLIKFNSVLSADNSPTDKLVINGNTSGLTQVSVNNLGGKGADTINGIELISVSGQSDGVFTQSGRIVAGAWDYHLVTRDGNWYLVNSGPTPAPDPDPTPSPDPMPLPDPTPIPKPAPNMRPEGGSYVANLAAANTLFNTRLHDRSGETWYVDPVTGEMQISSLWLRQVGSHNKWRDGSGQLKTQANSYVAQLGGDLAKWSTNGINEGRLGLMGGYANSRSKTTSSRSMYGSKGSLNGYSAGIYGTWFENKKDDAGLYVDSWLQYSWFNNHVNGEELASESYRSKGLTASVETGYTIKLGETIGSRGSINEWFIQPQAQATWMGVKASDHHESNGTVVKGEGDGNIQTRLGMRAYLRGCHAMDKDTGRTFQPFAEVNWLHNSRGFSATMDDASISQAGGRNLGEVKLGLEAKLNPAVNMWGNVGTQLGTEGYMDSSAMIGMKVNF